MKTKIFAVAATLSLGVGSAHADGPGGTIPNTFFTQLPGVTAKAPAQSTAIAHDRQAVHAYVTQSSRGTWLFQPHDGGGAND